MSNLKDLIDYPEKSNRLSLAYFLLLANILGMTILLGQKRSYSPSLTEKNETTKLTDEISSQDEKRENNEKHQPQSQLDKNKEQEKNELHATSNVAAELLSKAIIDEAKSDIVVREDKAAHQSAPGKTDTDHKDNVINFKTAATERKVQEKKEPLKPLVWNFPDTSPFFRKHVNNQ